MSEEEIINKVDKFIDIITVILPDYSTKIPEYCIDEETWIAIKALLDLYQKEKEKNKDLEKSYKLATEYKKEQYIPKSKVKAIANERNKKNKDFKEAYYEILNLLEE